MVFVITDIYAVFVNLFSYIQRTAECFSNGQPLFRLVFESHTAHRTAKELCCCCRARSMLFALSSYVVRWIVQESRSFSHTAKPLYIASDAIAFFGWEKRSFSTLRQKAAACDANKGISLEPKSGRAWRYIMLAFIFFVFRKISIEFSIHFSSIFHFSSCPVILPRKKVSSSSV